MDATLLDYELTIIKPRYAGEDNIKMELKETECEGVGRIYDDQNGNESSGIF
jgi:hypothetical protein